MNSNLNQVVKGFFGLVLRAILFLMGLVFFASVLVASLLLLVVWMVRALWARLTGQPVLPWVFRVNRHAQWSRFYRGAARGKAAWWNDADVIDVESKDLRSPGNSSDR